MHQHSILLLADAGVPMIFLTFPAMMALTLPIIFLEAWLCKKWLGISAWTALKSSAAANLASTLIGVPGAWLLMLCIEMATAYTVATIPALSRIAERWHSPIAKAVMALVSAAWLGPDEKNLYWMVPVAAFGLLLPTLFVSIWIETLVVNTMISMPEGDPSNLTSSRIRGAVRNANLATYTLLTLGTIAWLLFAILNPQK